ncbi:MAG: filamentous hemagglutinin family protein, partial [Sphingomonadaceae bacterium]
QGDIRSYTTTRSGAYTRVGSAAIGNWLWRQGAYGEAEAMGGADTPTAWWINFGGYVPNNPYNNSATAPNSHNGPLLEGFMGIGTLGGGNLTVSAGGNVGVMENWSIQANGVSETNIGVVASTALNLAVGGTGRVTDVTMVEGRVTGGTLVQTGGGDMIVKIGGSLNPGSGTNHAGDLNGTFVNLRGDMEIAAGSIGVIQPYIANVFELALEPRVPDPLNPAKAHSRGGISLVPGDGQVRITTRGDMVVAGAADPGRVTQSANAGVSYISMAEILPAPQAYWTADAAATFGMTEGALVTRQDAQFLIDQGYATTYDDLLAWYVGWLFTIETSDESTFVTARQPGDILRTGFSLWQPDTAISLFSAGGDLTPLVFDNTGNVDTRNVMKMDGGRYWFPGTLSVIAAHGDVFADAGNCSGTGTTCDGGAGGAAVLELAPSANGSLEFLVGGSIRGAGTYMASDGTRHPAGMAVGMSGMAWNANDVPNPFRPHWNTFYSRAWGGPANSGRLALTASPGVSANSLLPFQRDTALGTLYEGQRDPMRFYAVGGDITNFSVGFMDWQVATPNYIGAGPAEIRAGRDIVNFGSSPLLGCGSNGLTSCRTADNSYLSGAGTIRGYVVHNDPRDISVLSAGRDIIQSSMNIAGPGNLVVEAGRDIYQADRGIFRSVGPLYGLSPETRQGGASITILTGVGTGGPDYARFLDLYLNPAYLADAERPLAEQNIVNDEGFVEEVNKVAKNYGEELAAWLETRFGYEAEDADDARLYLATLTPQEQAIFARQVYFDELKIGGREYSGKIESGRLSSYLRSRLAIAALFPETDAEGNAISYGGNLTMFGASGVRTEFGGDIEMLVAGGQTTLGVGGIAPPSTAGVLSMGSGNVDIYSLGSILLGQSRVFTTFGGDIFMWAADGDINAGRGAKSTVVYQPPRRVYDSFGNVTLSPPTQNTGAGIATLAPIPEIPAGDVDLIAPLGVIDAGEAGIRVSGDINLAALQILNAANIKVEGEATGIPVMVAVNTGALTSASSAASAVANQAADLAERARPQGRTEIPTILNVRFLGFGE